MPPVSAFTPYARTINTVMCSVCLVLVASFTLVFMQQRLRAEDRYEDTALQASLERGISWLSATLVAGKEIDDSIAGSCQATDSNSRFHCARRGINISLKNTHPIHHIPEQLPEEELMADVMTSIRWLKNNGRSPETLSALLRRPAKETIKISRGDPFRLPGCLYQTKSAIKHASDSQATEICPDGSTLTSGVTPPGTQALLAHLNQYRAPTRKHAPNTHWHQVTADLLTPIQQGRHVWLGLTQSMHENAQITAACYTGDAAACGKCTWCNIEAAHDMSESARARAMGILVVNARTGAIEAAASAYTECYARQQRGEAPIEGCPRLPGALTPRPFRLGNQALEQTAMPGSETKPPIAVALVKAGLSAKELAKLPGIITRSSTEDLISLVMCKEANFDTACAQHRLRAIEETARGIGWNSKVDLLADYQIPTLQTSAFGARLLRRPEGKLIVSKNLRLSADALRKCHAQPLKQRWRNCQGEDLVNILAELFGQGNALASPVGIANGLLHLAAAQNGQSTAAWAHLVADVQTDKSERFTVTPRHELVANAEQVEPVVRGMLKTHTIGTARSACKKAAAMGGILSCIEGDPQPIRIASKTGTPVFSGDRQSLPSWRKQCDQAQRELTKAPHQTPAWYHWRNEIGKCEMRPIKWYAFMLGAPDRKGWDKIVVVLAERNWNESTGVIDTPDDIGPNVSAEAGLALANALYSPIFGIIPNGIEQQVAFAAHTQNLKP